MLVVFLFYNIYVVCVHRTSFCYCFFVILYSCVTVVVLSIKGVSCEPLRILTGWVTVMVFQNCAYLKAVLLW